MRLTGFLQLSNSTPNLVKFAVESAFCMHLVIRDSQNERVGISERFGKVLTYGIPLPLASQESLKYPFDIKLGDYFDLHPGRYRISFLYDIRLFRMARPGEWPFVKWSSEAVEIRVQRGSGRRDSQ